MHVLAVDRDGVLREPAVKGLATRARIVAAAADLVFEIGVVATAVEDVQLAKHAGAHVVATASPRSLEAVRRNGADQIIDYTRDSVASGVEPVDVMIHLVGTPPPWIPPVRPGGVIISAAAPVPAPAGVTSSHVVARFDTAQLTALVKLVDAGVVTVDVTESYPLEAIGEVHRRSEAGGIRGKVVIAPATR
jgi:NADPH:quinone reductase-like Zn-dependent oxidoreductase